MSKPLGVWTPTCLPYWVGILKWLSLINLSFTNLQGGKKKKERKKGTWLRGWVIRREGNHSLMRMGV